MVERRLAAAEAQPHAASARRITGPSTSGSGRSPPTRPRRGRTPCRQLREAVVWREILGPPVSLRDGRIRGARDSKPTLEVPRALGMRYRSAELLLVRRHRLRDRLPRRRGALESTRHRPGSLQILVHLEEVLDLLEVVRGDVAEIVEPVGVRDRPSGTASTFSSAAPRSTRWNRPIGRTFTRQPVKTGMVISTRTSSGSPSSPRVRGRKP